MSNKFQVRLKFEEKVENDIKKVSRNMILKSESITDLEVKVTELLASEDVKEFDVISLSEAKVNDVLIDTKSLQTYWFSIRMCIMMENEKGKQMKSWFTHLVKTDEPKMAISVVENIWSKTTYDYKITVVKETDLTDVLLDTIDA